MYEFYDLSRLPVISPARQTLQTSSFDRKNENGDFGQFLYKDENGESVMFDEVGGGCIKSIWSAIVTDETELHFYFGGSSEASYTVTLRGLFTGGLSFLSGAGNTLEERGHYNEAECVAGNCFIQIPYTNGLKITATGKLDFYYHIMYERYTIGESASRGLDDTACFQSALDGRYEIRADEKFESEVTLDKGYTHVWSSDKSGVITSFTVEVDESTDLSDIGLDISWDNNPISQVACPLRYLFAQHLGYTEIHSSGLDVTKSDGKVKMTFRLPMPYRKSADITLVDLPKTKVSLKLSLTVSEYPYGDEDVGYFCADYRQGLTELFGDWLIGEFPGRGNIAGVIQTCVGGQYCEGNEHFYINGAVVPQINGTGTEDFYLGCWWPNLKYDSVCAGCINDVYLMGGSTIEGSFINPSCYYRFLLDMPISYQNGIKLCIQHGAVGQTYSDYSSLCLSYRMEEPLYLETDFINVSSEASRRIHSYEAESATDITLTSKNEGDRREPTYTRSGYLHESGRISFTAALDDDNRGMVLRRLYDQSYSPQRGTVYIDGDRVGEWYNPGFNETASFADSDFIIPPLFTIGKGSVKVEIDCTGLTDFEYRVFSVKKQ